MSATALSMPTFVINTATPGYEARLQFLNITPDTRATLQKALPAIESVLPGILTQFYAFIGQYPELMAKFDNNPMILERAKQKQQTHWLNLFSGQFDASYFQNITTVGQTHERKALEPRYYIGGYNFAVGHLIEALCKHYAKQPEQLSVVLQSVMKAVFLDMDMAITVYNDTVKQTAGTKLGQVVTSLEGVLENVSELDTDVSSVAAAVEEASCNTQEVVKASQLVHENVIEVGASAQSMSSSMADVLTLTSDMKSNMSSVAKAMEELSVSFNEVARNTNDASTVASKASETIQKTTDIVSTLG